MSSGPEHYAAAEKAIGLAKGVDFEHAAFLHREAQAHATLALVAALLDRETGTQAQRNGEVWREATT